MDDLRLKIPCSIQAHSPLRTSLAYNNVKLPFQCLNHRVVVQEDVLAFCLLLTLQELILAIQAKQLDPLGSLHQARISSILGSRFQYNFTHIEGAFELYNKLPSSRTNNVQNWAKSGACSDNKGPLSTSPFSRHIAASKLAHLAPVLRKGAGCVLSS